MPDSFSPQRNRVADRQPFANARWLCYRAIARNRPAQPVPERQSFGARRAIKSPVLRRLQHSGRLRIPERRPGMRGPIPGPAAGLYTALKRKAKEPEKKKKWTGFSCARYLQITTAPCRAGLGRRKNVLPKTK